MAGCQSTPALPHVLIFPLPLQGPVNCMLKMAELFCLADIHVTFLNTHHIQQRLLRYADVESTFKRYPNFQFRTIPDGLPEDNPRTRDQILELFESMDAVSAPLLRDMLKKSAPYSDDLGPDSEKPVTCIIADGFFSFAVGVAKEVAVPLIYFDTVSPCGLWAYLCVPKLVESGEYPFEGDDLDEPITCLPEMECIIRRRDLPSFYRDSKLEDRLIQLVLKEDQQLPLAQALIFNTFEDLDRSTLNQMRSLGPKVYSIGPLQLQLKTRLALTAASSNTIWKEDKSCMAWLDKQPPKSVVYVSIGSLAVMTKDHQLEIWHGLVNSGVRFLWVQRQGSITGGSVDDEELARKTEAMGYIVSWAPQEKVLGHPAIGGFLTHSGWNSTLESIVEGVPMICWPHFVDQQVNSRYVEQVWRLGLDMKDRCDRSVVEKMVREVMELRREEFLKRADDMAEMAKASVREGGSSYNDMNNLIEDITLMRLKAW